MGIDFQYFVRSLGFELENGNENGKITSTARSFTNVFCRLFDTTSDYIFQNINDQNFRVHKQKYLHMEFSNQKNWIQQEIFSCDSKILPIIYSCATVCRLFNYDIILICDVLNFSHIHKSNRLIRFCSDNNNGNCVAVGLDGSNIFKLLRYTRKSEEFLQLISTIPKQATISLDIELSQNELETLNENISNSHVSNSNHFDEGVNNITIREYIDTYGVSQKSKVTASSFSNNDRIDINRSDFRYKHESLFSFRKNFDIDAFFGLFNDLDFHNCLLSGGKIVKFKDLNTNKREMATIKKVFEDSNLKSFTYFKCIKFAEIESSNLFELFAVAAGTKSCRQFNSFDLNKCLESAHSYANRFPCISNNCSHSEDHCTTRNGRPDFLNQIKSYTFKWDYGSNSFKCLIKSMVDYVKDCSSKFKGLKVYYYVKSIGSKFGTIFTSLNQLDSQIKNFLSPFDLSKLLAIKETKFFIDIAWNINPHEFFNNEKVTLFQLHIMIPINYL